MSESIPFQAMYGTPGGVALALNADDPNTVPPDDLRVVHCRRVPCAGSVPSSIVAVVADGTTVTLVPWVYDSATAQWWQFGPASTITPAHLVKVVDAVNLDNVLLFFQITANTGVTAIGFQFGP